MRGGKFERTAATVVRNAEALLESRSAAEIREVEAATRKEMESKGEELRQLVGASYRDLIDSADSILMMANCCQGIADNVASMGQGLCNFASGADAQSSRDASSMQVMKRLYAMGSRVKYLVDTPEKIWGCLDEHMYLEAAERYLRARVVQDLLSGTELELLTIARFPLLLETTFQSHISLRSRDRLQDMHLSAAEYADALAAVAIMEDMSCSQVLSLFLDSRRMWLRSYLRGAKLEPPSSTAPHLCKALQVIQLALCHAGQLFLEVSHGTPPLLLSTVLATPPSSQLFGGIFNPEGELRIWKVHREKLEARMVALSQDLIAQVSLSFVSSCANELSSQAKPLLAAVSSGKELAQVESSIRLEMEKQEALEGSVDWLKAAFGGDCSSPWGLLSDLVLKKRLDLWNELFESWFTHKLEAIINSRTDGISATVEMADNHLHEMTLASCLQQPRIGLLKHIQPGGGKPAEWNSDCTSYFGPDVCWLRDRVDQGLKLLLDDLLTFLGDPRGSSRTERVTSYLHEALLSRMVDVSNKLQKRLKKISEALDQGPAALEALVQIERALYLGRMALALGAHLSYLPTLLGAPEKWLDEAAESNNVASDHLKNLQNALRGQWELAHTLWVSWSTSELARLFSADLFEDGCHSGKGWEETVLKQGDELELKISLPAFASPSTVSLLFLATQEIYRVGGHVLDRSIVHSFAASLLDKVLSTFEDFVHKNPESEPLQLLFDLRFLADVLAGSSETPPVANRRLELPRPRTQKRLKELVSCLSSKLDPIDWATYEAQLWENEQRFYQRSAVLFGFLTALEVEHKAQLAFNLGQQNTLNLTVTVPRLNYLPITVPSASPTGHPSPRPNDFGGLDMSNEAADCDPATSLTALVNPRPLFRSIMGQVGNMVLQRGLI